MRLTHARFVSAGSQGESCPSNRGNRPCAGWEPDGHDRILISAIASRTESPDCAARIPFELSGLAAECTDAPHVVMEGTLSHVVQNKVEAAMPARICSSQAEADGGLHRLPQGETWVSAPAPPVTDSRGSDRHALRATCLQNALRTVGLNASGTPWTSRVFHTSLDNFANHRSHRPRGHPQLPIVERMKQETWTLETQN